MPTSELEAAEFNRKLAAAACDVGAAVLSEARAALKQAEINLGYTTIRSPIKGIVIDRRVNAGQTVVANLNAPSLFLIAADLKKVQVWASVNEADVGRIKQGQPVRFTVDAYQGRTFRGHGGTGPPQRRHDAKHGLVHGGCGDRQRRGAAAALPDRQRQY